VAKDINEEERKQEKEDGKDSGLIANQEINSTPDQPASIDKEEKNKAKPLPFRLILGTDNHGPVSPIKKKQLSLKSTKRTQPPQPPQPPQPQPQQQQLEEVPSSNPEEETWKIVEESTQLIICSQDQSAKSLTPTQRPRQYTPHTRRAMRGSVSGRGSGRGLKLRSRPSERPEEAATEPDITDLSDGSTTDSRRGSVSDTQSSSIGSAAGKKRVAVRRRGAAKAKASTIKMEKSEGESDCAIMPSQQDFVVSMRLSEEDREEAEERRREKARRKEAKRAEEEDLACESKEMEEQEEQDTNSLTDAPMLLFASEDSLSCSPPPSGVVAPASVHRAPIAKKKALKRTAKKKKTKQGWKRQEEDEEGEGTATPSSREEKASSYSAAEEAEEYEGEREIFTQKVCVGRVNLNHDWLVHSPEVEEKEDEDDISSTERKSQM